MVDFYGMMDWFVDVGGFDIILPFFLIFAISFAILQKIKLFGEPDKAKKFNVVISLILAFFLVIQQELVIVIQNFLPRVSMVILFLLMVLLVIGIFGVKPEWSGGLLTFGAIIGVIGVLWAIGASLGWAVPLYDWITEQDIAVLIVLGIFVLVIWLIVKEPGKKESGAGKIGGALNKIGEMLKGGS